MFKSLKELRECIEEKSKNITIQHQECSYCGGSLIDSCGYEEFIEFRNDYYTNKEETLGMLANIYEHSTINTQVLLAMNGNIAQLTKNFQEFQGSFEEFKMNVQNNHEELMEKLANLEAGSVDYQKFEDMFKQLGLTITDAINMSKEELIAKLDEFEQTYITTEESQTQLLQKINNDVNLIVNFPGIDQSAVIEALNKLTEAVNKLKQHISHAHKIEVECDTIEQVKEALNCGVDIIMLDNMSVDMMRECVSIINKKAIVEASGNVNLSTVHEIASTGVDIISSSAIVAKAPTLDLGLDCK